MTWSERPYTTQEVANLTGLSANAVRKEIHIGRLPATFLEQGKSGLWFIARGDAWDFAARIAKRKEKAA